MAWPARIVDLHMSCKSCMSAVTHGLQHSSPPLMGCSCCVSLTDPRGFTDGGWHPQQATKTIRMLRMTGTSLICNLQVLNPACPCCFLPLYRPMRVCHWWTAPIHSSPPKRFTPMRSSGLSRRMVMILYIMLTANLCELLEIL